MGVVTEYYWQNSGDLRLRDVGYGGAVISPLAVVAPESSREYNEDEEGGLGLEPEEVSKKVLSQISEVSRILGVTFEGFEQVAMRLFSAIEVTWKGKMPKKGQKVN